MVLCPLGLPLDRLLGVGSEVVIEGHLARRNGVRVPLRRALGEPSPLRTEHDGVSLDPAMIAVDVPEFGQLQFAVDTGAVRCSPIQLHSWFFDSSCRSGAINNLFSERARTIHGDRHDKAGTLAGFRFGPHGPRQCDPARSDRCVVGWEFLAHHRRITLDIPDNSLILESQCPAEIDRPNLTLTYSKQYESAVANVIRQLKTEYRLEIEDISS